MVHVGSVDAPVAVDDIKSTIREFWKLVGKDKTVQTNGIDFLGWDFALILMKLPNNLHLKTRLMFHLKKFHVKC